jgi:hypothetical protein
VKGEKIRSFLTHYYEAERGPFKNVCDLTEEEIDHLISVEKDAETGFNRFALGRDFFKIRRTADDLLIERYGEKFGFSPLGRPFYAVLGEFDRTLSMYRLGRSIRLDMSRFSREQVTFMYPDHFVLVWSKGLYPPPRALFGSSTYSYEAIHDCLFTYDELPEAFVTYSLEDRITRAKRRDLWVSSYIEAHVWDSEIRERLVKETKDIRVNLGGAR